MECTAWPLPEAGRPPPGPCACTPAHSPSEQLGGIPGLWCRPLRTSSEPGGFLLRGAHLNPSLEQGGSDGKEKAQECLACYLKARRLQVALDRHFLDTYCVSVPCGKGFLTAQVNCRHWEVCGGSGSTALVGGSAERCPSTASWSRSSPLGDHCSESGAAGNFRVRTVRAGFGSRSPVSTSGSSNGGVLSRVSVGSPHALFWSFWRLQGRIPFLTLSSQEAQAVLSLQPFPHLHSS